MKDYMTRHLSADKQILAKKQAQRVGSRILTCTDVDPLGCNLFGLGLNVGVEVFFS